MFVSCPQWVLTQRGQILLCCWVSEWGTAGKRPGSVSGYEDHVSCGQPQGGFVGLGAIKPGPKVLFRVQQSLTWRVVRTPQGKPCQAEVATKAEECGQVRVH